MFDTDHPFNFGTTKLGSQNETKARFAQTGVAWEPRLSLLAKNIVLSS